MRATGSTHQAAQCHSCLCPGRSQFRAASAGRRVASASRCARYSLAWLLVGASLLICSSINSWAGDGPLFLAQAAPSSGQPSTDPAAPFIQGDFWALVIGINEYPNLPPARQLQAARPGAEAVARILRQYGVERERIRAVYDRNATRSAVVSHLQTVLQRDVAPADSLFIYFAGQCAANPATKDVAWLLADAADQNAGSFLYLKDLQMLLSQVPARHIFLVADSCVEEDWIGTSAIGEDSTVREVSQKKSRWVLASGVASPQPEAAGQPGASAFTRHFVEVLRDQQLAYLTPLHLERELAERLQPAARQALRHGPLTGLGDDNGQFVFRLEGATPPTAEIRVPAKADPRLAMLRQYIETGRTFSLPQDLKQQVLADLQGQVDALQQEIQSRRRRQEEARLKTLEEWRRRPAR